MTVDIAKQQTPVRAFLIRVRPYIHAAALRTSNFASQPFFDSTSEHYAEDCPAISTFVPASVDEMSMILT